jgi:phage tail-like protein
MAVQRDRPYGNYNFLVDLGGGDSAAAGFAEVVLPDGWFDVIEYRNGNEKESVARKIPGRVHYGNLVLKRGVIGVLDLYHWWNQLRNGDIGAYRTVSIQLQNEDRTETVLVWRLYRCWPVRYQFTNLQAQGKQVLLEILELAFERLDVE